MISPPRFPAVIVALDQPDEKSVGACRCRRAAQEPPAEEQPPPRRLFQTGQVACGPCRSRRGTAFPAGFAVYQSNEISSRPGGTRTIRGPSSTCARISGNFGLSGFFRACQACASRPRDRAVPLHIPRSLSYIIMPGRSGRQGLGVTFAYGIQMYLPPVIG